MKLFKNYKAEFDMSCKVMKSMAEEIIRLREENDMLHEEVKELEKERDRNADLVDAQNKRVQELRSKISEAIQTLSKK